MKKLTPDLEQELRQSIKPNYADVYGTESYERSAMLEEIDMLRAAIWETINNNLHLADNDRIMRVELSTLRKINTDLYAALELLANQTRDGMGHEYDDGEWPALDNARAALAKARGENEH